MIAELQKRTQIIQVWWDLLEIVGSDPNFAEIRFTERYFEEKDLNLKVKYDAFNIRLWSLVREISLGGFKKENQFHMMVRWAVSYHNQWLVRNPGSFIEKKFWSHIEEVRRTSSIIYRARPLPVKMVNGERRIDWTRAAPKYLEYIISPNDPRMLEIKDAHRRNLLLNLLEEKKDKVKTWRVADYGCGPGKLLERLDEIDVQFAEFIGIDVDKGVLKEVEKIINAFKTTGKIDSAAVYRTELKDFRFYKLTGDGLDLIVSINAVLPTKAGLVKSGAKDIDEYLEQAINSIHENLKDGGYFFGILPAFEACKTLVGYWEKEFKEEFERAKKFSQIFRSFDEKQREYVLRNVEAFKKNKLMEKKNSLYADDGYTQQHYLTKKNILSAFKKEKWELIPPDNCADKDKPLGRIEYPWEMARQYDYGYFRDEEEIWDWFVIAKKK